MNSLSVPCCDKLTFTYVYTIVSIFCQHKIASLETHVKVLKIFMVSEKKWREKREKWKFWESLVKFKKMMSYKGQMEKL